MLGLSEIDDLANQVFGVSSQASPATDKLVVGDDSGNTIIGSAGNDVILGLGGSDWIDGWESNDFIFGGDGQDILNGQSGEDEIFGGKDNDILDGGAESDVLEGGGGYDVYLADDLDTILDSDGKGLVKLNGKVLTGGSRTEDDPEGVYKNGNDTYKLSGNTLTINGGLVIEEYTKSSNDLGIELKDEDEEEDEDPSTPSIDDAENTTSPLILDLDGDGIETTRLLNFFDHDGDGFQEKTGWVGAGDGFLARDLNGDGNINSGLELFGNNTQLESGAKAENGFQAWMIWIAMKMVLFPVKTVRGPN